MRSFPVVLAVLIAAAVAFAQEPSPALETTPEPEILFRNITDAAGITFEHRSAPEKKYIVESMSGGVALFDYNLDGRLDIYFVNSLTVDTADQPETAPSALYENQGGGRFEDVAKKAGVAFPGWGMGACTADADGDGFEELYVTNLGKNRFYHNQGDGTFEEIAEKAGVEAGGWSGGCGFADVDNDGDLDLFVSRYVEIDLGDLPQFGKDKTCQYRGVAVQCGPRGLPGVTDLLYRNDISEGGKLRFTDVSKMAGVDDPDEYFGLGVAFFDANEDGFIDLFVANDSTPNFFYQNKGDGTFEDVAFPMGVAVSEDGAEQGGMGVAIGDYQNDGRIDLYVTNFAEEYNTLYKNDGGYFSDISFRSATAAASLPYVGWGTAFFDYDNDGWSDLIVVNGHVYPQLDNARLGASAPYRQKKLLFRNKGNGTFEEIGERFGPIFTDLQVSRGLALGDLDDDGRIDVVVNDLDGRPQVLRNVYPDTGHWLRVKLIGEGQNRGAVGARIRVTTGETTQSRVVQSGTSYLSQDDKRQHFGLGPANKADRVEILWPDGTTSVEEHVDADQTLTIEKPATEAKPAAKP